MNSNKIQSLVEQLRAELLKVKREINTPDFAVFLSIRCGPLKCAYAEGTAQELGIALFEGFRHDTSLPAIAKIAAEAAEDYHNDNPKGGNLIFSNN